MKMKKLMMVLATACAASLVQAAAVNWSATNVYAGNSTDKASGVIGYLFLADQVSVAEAQTALAAGGADLTALLAKGLTPETSTSAGKFTADTLNPSSVADSYGGTSANAFAVIFNTGDPTTATSYYITPEVTATIKAVGNSTFAFGTQAANSQTAWSSVGGSGGGEGGVPEPTSALLLLMGGAMLALRRRRA